MKSILFPFVYKTDFKAGYAWSLELAARLQGQLSIFTTVHGETRQHYSELYESLIKARQFYVRELGMLGLGKKNPSVIRHFLQGDFESTLLKFIDDTKFDVLVLPTRVISEATLTKLIHSHKQIICLPAVEAEEDHTQPTPTRESFFLEMLHRAVCYNLPSSFYKSFADDKSLFNSIASFFRRPEINITKFTMV